MMFGFRRCGLLETPYERTCSKRARYLAGVQLDSHIIEGTGLAR